MVTIRLKYDEIHEVIQYKLLQKLISSEVKIGNKKLINVDILFTEKEKKTFEYILNEKQYIETVKTKNIFGIESYKISKKGRNFIKKYDEIMKDRWMLSATIFLLISGPLIILSIHMFDIQTSITEGSITKIWLASVIIGLILILARKK